MTYLCIPVKSTDYSDDLVNLEVANIKHWAQENKMKLIIIKTFEKVVKGRTKKPLPVTIEGIGRKSELKLLGVTFNEDPCNWDTHFEQMLEKASSRLYILRICKYYGYSLQELAILFESLIVSLFKYAISLLKMFLRSRLY